MNSQLFRFGYNRLASHGPPIIDVLKGGHVQAAYLLLKHGADLDSKCHSGYNVACYVAGLGDTQLISNLAVQGVNFFTEIELEDEAFTHVSPIVHAVFELKTAAVQAILSILTVNTYRQCLKSILSQVNYMDANEMK